MAIENKIKFAMREKGKSRSDISTALNISDAAVSNKFYRDSFSAEDLIKIAECLGFRLAFIDESQEIVFTMSDIDK